MSVLFIFGKRTVIKECVKEMEIRNIVVDLSAYIIWEKISWVHVYRGQNNVRNFT